MAAAGVLAPQQGVEGSPRVPRLLLPLALRCRLTAAPALRPYLPASLLVGVVEGALVPYLLLSQLLAVVAAAACLTSAAALHSWLPWSCLPLLLESPTCSCAYCQHLHCPLLLLGVQQGQDPPQHPTQAAVGPQGQGWVCALRLPAVVLLAAWGPSLEYWQQGEGAPEVAQQAVSGRQQLPYHLAAAGYCRAFRQRLVLLATASRCGQTGGVAGLPVGLALLLTHHPSPLLLLVPGNQGGWGAEQAAAAAAVATRPAQSAEASPMARPQMAAVVVVAGRQEVGLALPAATSQAAAVVAAVVALAAAAAAVTAAVPAPATEHLAVLCRLLLQALPLPPLQVAAVLGSAVQCGGHSVHQHKHRCQPPQHLGLGEVAEVLPPAAAAASWLWGCL